jgi:hypothetical protein
VLQLQYPVLVLVFKQYLCCCLTRWLGLEMNFLDSYLPYFRQWLITHILSAVYFSRLFLLKVHVDFSSLLLPPSLVSSEQPSPSAAYPFQFLVYYQAFFLLVKGQSVQGTMMVYPRGSSGNTAWLLFAHLLFCVSQAGLGASIPSRGSPPVFSV